MLDLRRLRLLHELHARGTIAAVADALQFTPSAVSQQLAVLEREAGVPLLERAGRGVRLTDAAIVLVRHAEALLERAELRGGRAGRGRGQGRRAGADRLVPVGRAPPRRAGDAGARAGGARPALRADRGRARAVAARARARRRRSRARRRVAAPAARAAGRRRPRGPACATRSTSCCPRTTRPPRRHRDAVPLAELAGEAWTTGHPETGWEEMTERTCRELGGFDPDIRHRTNDSVTSLALVADGQAVTLLPAARGPGGPPGRRRAGDRRGLRAPHDLHGDPQRGCRAPLGPGAPRGRAHRGREPWVACGRCLGARPLPRSVQPCTLGRGAHDGLLVREVGRSRASGEAWGGRSVRPGSSIC